MPFTQELPHPFLHYYKNTSRTTGQSKCAAHTYIHIHINIWIYIYIYMYIHVYAYIYTFAKNTYD